MQKTTVEKVFDMLDKTLFKIICKTDEEREAMKRYLLAVQIDLARIGVIYPREHLHKRGFPGAVFTQQRVDFPVPELQRNIVVGDNAREPFGDIQHLNGIFAFMRISQCATPTFEIDPFSAENSSFLMAFFF